MNEPTPIVTPIRRARQLAYEFLDRRLPWLADAGSVQVAHTPDGGWDVALRIDGTYTTRDSAEEIADLFRDDVNELVEALNAARATERDR